MFISNNRVSFHLWWKENLSKHQKVSKYYESGCRNVWKLKEINVFYLLAKTKFPRKIFLLGFRLKNSRPIRLHDFLNNCALWSVLCLTLVFGMQRVVLEKKARTWHFGKIQPSIALACSTFPDFVLIFLGPVVNSSMFPGITLDHIFHGFQFN